MQQNAANLQIMHSDDLKKLSSLRTGEVKLGEALGTLDDLKSPSLLSALRDSLGKKVAQGARYALLGIPEDIGPRANSGRGGSDKAWQAFIGNFVNLQKNQFIDASKIIVIGATDLTDLQTKAQSIDNQSPSDLQKLRELCAEIDSRVTPIVHQISSSGLTPIVIGGGHNNVLGIQRGIADSLKEKGKSIELGCINCDPHADFRPMEGRHSGNGFTHAFHEGILKAYYILGLHEGYNSQNILDSLRHAGFKFRTYEDIFIRAKLSWEQAITESINYLQSLSLPAGIELDLDSIKFVPCSAETPNGVSSEDAARFIYKVASTLKDIAYLHLPEGAPELHSNLETGKRYLGRTICNQVMSFIKGREERNA